MPLKLEAIEIEANNHTDPAGLKWRIMLIEERIYEKRVKKYNADSARRNKGKK